MYAFWFYICNNRLNTVDLAVEAYVSLRKNFFWPKNEGSKFDFDHSFF